MSGGIEEDPKTLGGRLIGCGHGAESDGFSLGLVQMIDGQVEVHLLGPSTLRPGGGCKIGNAHGRQPDAVGLHRDELLAGIGDLAAEKVSPERAQCQRVGTVQ